MIWSGRNIIFKECKNLDWDVIKNLAVVIVSRMQKFLSSGFNRFKLKSPSDKIGFFATYIDLV